MSTDKKELTFSSLQAALAMIAIRYEKRKLNQENRQDKYKKGDKT